MSFGEFRFLLFFSVGLVVPFICLSVGVPALFVLYVSSIVLVFLVRVPWKPANGEILE